MASVGGGTVEAATHSKFAATRVDGRKVVVIPPGAEGPVLWGPYQTLEPGRYQVTFQITPMAYAQPSDPCCEIDVTTNAGNKLLLRHDLSVRDVLAAGNRVAVTFEAGEVDRFEYRVHALGGAGFRVDYSRLAWPVDRPFDPTDIANSEVYAENSTSIDFARQCGAEMWLSGDTLFAKIDGVLFDIQCAGDIQVVGDIFQAREYDILPPFPCIAIDIGMNAGLASLVLARKPQVETVFGYEPFQTPFRRALTNFSRNPELANKLHPENIGLADRNEILDVKFDPQATINNSIRGVTSGPAELITIRDAASELGPKITAAAERGLGVVMKVDCEGSEFAIFDSLRRAALFPKIDAFMIEWHKWWSAELSQADLIAPLAEAGYVVFDRTHPADPWAGLLYAVRSARGGVA